MKVVTIVKGNVPTDRATQFETSYRQGKGTRLPPGLETSLLLRSSEEPGAYMIETVWSSREVLQAMRSSEKPRAIVLFEEVGASPKVEIFEVAETVP